MRLPAWCVIRCLDRRQTLQLSFASSDGYRSDTARIKCISFSKTYTVKYYNNKRPDDVIFWVLKMKQKMAILPGRGSQKCISGGPRRPTSKTGTFACGSLGVLELGHRSCFLGGFKYVQKRRRRVIRKNNGTYVKLGPLQHKNRNT